MFRPIPDLSFFNRVGRHEITIDREPGHGFCFCFCFFFSLSFFPKGLDHLVSLNLTIPCPYCIGVYLLYLSLSEGFMPSKSLVYVVVYDTSRCG